MEVNQGEELYNKVKGKTSIEINKILKDIPNDIKKKLFDKIKLNTSGEKKKIFQDFPEDIKDDYTKYKNRLKQGKYYSNHKKRHAVTDCF